MGKFHFKVSSLLAWGSFLALLVPILWMPYSQSWVDSANNAKFLPPTVLNVNQTLGQSFTATENGLYQIKLFVKPSPVILKGRFFLSESVESKTSLIEQNFTIIPNTNHIHPMFDPIKDSAGKSYYFYMEADIKNTEAISFIRLLEDREGGTQYLNHEPVKGDLIFRPLYSHETSYIGQARTLFQNMSQYKPVWAKTPYLYIYFLGFMLSVFWLVRYLIVEAFTDQNKHK